MALQVFLSQAQSIKSSLAVIVAATAELKASPGQATTVAKAPKAKKPKPAYLEIQAHLQQIVFCLEQNPLETWIGLHGPVLQAMAAERHLAEQLLASCSSAHGRISRTGESRSAGNAKASDAAGQTVQLGAAGGKKQRGQWQKRRWGSLGKRGAAVTAAIAAGSVTDAALAAATGPAAAAMAAALGSGSSPLHKGLVGAQNHAAKAAKSAKSAAASQDEVAGADGSSLLPSSPDEAAAADIEIHSEAEAASDDEGLLHGTAEGDPVASESSEELDSSEEEDPGLMDPDALAAVLPSSASALAGSAAGPAGSKQLPQGSVHLLDSLGAAAAGEQGITEMQQAVLQAHTELFSVYKFRCRPLHAVSEDLYHPSRAVMHISVARAEAVVLICLPGHTASAKVAREVVSRVDPASEGIVMERFQTISLDVGMQDLVAHFGGVEEVSMSCLATC